MATENSGNELTKSKVFDIIEYNETNIISTLEVEELPKFKCREDDVWVCSFPRSGTTLTQQITYLIMTLDFEKATTVQLDERFPIADLNEPAYPYFRGLKYLDSLPENKPRMIKSHLPYYILPEQLQQGKGKIIFITRNPKASLVSFYRVLCYMAQPPAPTLVEYVQMFLDGKGVLSVPWEKHFHTYYDRRNEEHVLFIQFEKLVKDRRGMIRKIAEFLGKDLTDEQVDKIFEYTTIESMKNNNAVNFMYFEDQFISDKQHGGYINTGEVSGWRREFPQEHIEEMDKLIERATKDTDIKYE